MISRLVRRFLTAPVDTEIVKLIKQPRRLHDGHDEAKAVIAQARRAHADAKRWEAAQIQSGSKAPSKLIVVGREVWR